MKISKLYSVILGIFLLHISEVKAAGDSLRATGKYLNNKKEGVWIYSLANNIVQYSVFRNDVLNGPNVKYYPSGYIQEISNYENGIPIGLIVKFYDSLKVKEIYFNDKNREQTGPRYVFQVNGNLTNEQFWPVKEGKGFFNSALCDNRQTVKVINDSVFFLGNSWYSNGKPQVLNKTEILNDKTIVHFTLYSRSGLIELVGSFIFDCRKNDCCWYEFGKWEYFKEGKLIRTETY